MIKWSMINIFMIIGVSIYTTKQIDFPDRLFLAVNKNCGKCFISSK